MDLTNFRNDAGLLQYGEGFERGLFPAVDMASPFVSYRNKSCVGCTEEYPTAPVANLYERLSGMISSKDNAKEQPNDALQWLLNAHKKQKGTDMTLEGMTNEQLFLAVASIYTTSYTATNVIVYDLLTYAEYIEKLWTEIEQVWAQNGQCTKKSLA